MGHLEGVLTLVSDTGPWFRIQGRHVREGASRRLGVRVALDPHSGVTVDVHVGRAVWVRAGWYPSHPACTVQLEGPLAAPAEHRCWGRWLRPRVVSHGMVA